MRNMVFDKSVRVRLPGVILSAASVEAARRGMTLSEFMRDALRAQVGIH